MDLKVALNEHDVILDEQIDDFKTRIVSTFLVTNLIGLG